MNNKDYLVQKKPFRALLVFALPIILGNLFQQLYTMADTAIVGRYVGETALAAVGASYALTNVFICIAIGGGIGASVAVSRCFGAQQYGKMKTAAYTALISFAAVSVIMGILGAVFCRSLMKVLRTPADALALSVDYLRIYFLGLPFLFMYNVMSSMFNALGKSRIPLAFLIFSSAFNVALDIWMVKTLHMGVKGAALATVISQGISVILSAAVFFFEIRKLTREKTKLFDIKELGGMTKIALPSVFQQSTVSIGMMLVQSVVNGFGSVILAGYSAAARIESICVVPMVSIGNALSSYTAQNIGAGKPERIPKGLKSAAVMVVASGFVLCVLLELYSRNFIELFSENGSELAIATGQGYMEFTGWFLCIIGFKMSVDGVLRGAGDMKMFTVANTVNLAIRFSVAAIFAPKYGIAMVWYAVPMGWFANLVISFLQYRTGKWKRIYKTPEKL